MYIKIPGYCLLTLFPFLQSLHPIFLNWIYSKFIPRFSFFTMKSRNDRSQLPKLMLISNIPDVIPHSGKALWIMEIICCFMSQNASRYDDFQPLFFHHYLTIFCSVLWIYSGHGLTYFQISVTVWSNNQGSVFFILWPNGLS